jgi:hypothetical protein
VESTNPGISPARQRRRTLAGLRAEILAELARAEKPEPVELVGWL